MRNWIVVVIGILVLVSFVVIMKEDKESIFIRETEKELFEMKNQKDSVFQIADEVTKYTVQLKHQNDSLSLVKPKETIKIIEKEVIKTIEKKDTEDENGEVVIKSMPLERFNDEELERLKEELRMTRWTIYNLSSERDSLLIRLNNLQSEIDSLKLKK